MENRNKEEDTEKKAINKYRKDKNSNNSYKHTISDNLESYENKVNNVNDRNKIKNSLSISSINSYKNTSPNNNKIISNKKDYESDNRNKKVYFSKRFKNIHNK